MRRIASLVAALALLGGCATVDMPQHPAPQSFGEAIASIKGDTVIDLNAADAIAVAHGDAIAHACYPVLAKYVGDGTGTATVDQIKGAVSAFEEARVTRRGVEAGGRGIPDELKIACSPLLLDEQNFIIRMAALLGLSAVPGGAAAAPILNLIR